MVRLKRLCLTGLGVGLLLGWSLPVLALHPNDRREIQRLMKRTQACTGKRTGLALLERPLTENAKPEVFVFCQAEQRGSNQQLTWLTVFAHDGNAYRILAASPVGNAQQRIDTHYLEVRDGEILLRSSELDEVDNQNVFGEDLVFYRWTIRDRQLVQNGDKWLKKGRRLLAALPKAP